MRLSNFRVGSGIRVREGSDSGLVTGGHALQGSPDKQLEVLERGWRSLRSSAGNYTHWSGRGEFLDEIASRIYQLGSEFDLGIEFDGEA